MKVLVKLLGDLPEINKKKGQIIYARPTGNDPNDGTKEFFVEGGLSGFHIWSFHPKDESRNLYPYVCEEVKKVDLDWE
jgi:hypothetical protein